MRSHVFKSGIPLFLTVVALLPISCEDTNSDAELSAEDVNKVVVAEKKSALSLAAYDVTITRIYCEDDFHLVGDDARLEFDGEQIFRNDDMNDGDEHQINLDLLH